METAGKVGLIGAAGAAGQSIAAALSTAGRPYRAIGVVYRPETERQSHYLSARLADTFDAVIHLDHTAALEPLLRHEGWDDAEPPETYPSGL